MCNKWYNTKFDSQNCGNMLPFRGQYLCFLKKQPCPFNFVMPNVGLFSCGSNSSLSFYENDLPILIMFKFKMLLSCKNNMRLHSSMCSGTSKSVSLLLDIYTSNQLHKISKEMKYNTSIYEATGCLFLWQFSDLHTIIYFSGISGGKARFQSGHRAKNERNGACINLSSLLWSVV